MKILGLVALASVALGAAAWAEKDASDTDAVEWGRVAWLRDFDRAAEAAKGSGKPILLLFQEVPG